MPAVSRAWPPDVSQRGETSTHGGAYTARMSRADLPNRYQLAEFGTLLAEPARAAMLLALMDGSARPAGTGAMLDAGWLRRSQRSRALLPSDDGLRRLARLGVRLDEVTR